MKVLGNIMLAIVLWYGSQFIFGSIMGFIAVFFGLNMDDIFVPVVVGGLLSSVITEIIFWTSGKKKTQQ